MPLPKSGLDKGLMSAASGQLPDLSLPDWLDYIERLHRQNIDMGLVRVSRVARRLGIDLSDRVVITVGGTNGKGSTCALLEAILISAGYRVGLYTSPHLVNFNERIRLNSENASDAALVEVFQRIEAARCGSDSDGGPSEPIELTYFEFTTLAGFKLFQDIQLDVVILEVGLGGRLDAVNCIDADCAIVTSIDIDHRDYLGDTREQIAWEKAHIYRKGKVAVCADPMAPQSLIDHAQSIQADLWLFGRDFNYSGDKQQWSYGGRSVRRRSMAYPALRGANQLLNASAALAALEGLSDRLPVSQQAVREGLARVDLPGRFQVLAGRPTTILDVAHNPHAAAHLATNLNSMGFYPQTFALFGAMADKDMVGIVRAIKNSVDHWLLVALPGPRAASLAQLSAALKEAGIEDNATQGVKASELKTVETYDDVGDAWAKLQKRVGEADRIVVFGSFVTVAQVLQRRT
jgi:dihydrofolate synthase / folylpolyglutamate synthase